MTSDAAAPINRTSAARYDIDGLLAAIDGVPIVTDPVAVRRRSRDFFWYSPILNQQLARQVGRYPGRAARRSRRHAGGRRLRASAHSADGAGGGTGNYGQAVPLEGGVLLDINSLNADRMAQAGRHPGAGRREDA